MTDRSAGGPVAAIVLAAGRGSRFGPDPKLLARLDGMPLVRHAVEAATAAGCAPVLAVVGHRAAEIGAALAGTGARLVPSPDHALGLSASLRAGFAALPAGCAGAAILLGDMPRVTGGIVRTLIAGWRAAGCPDAAIPVRAGRRGNPVLLSARLGPEIAALRGDTGAAALLRDRPGVLEVPVDDGAVFLDVDTPDALAAAQAEASTTPSRIAE